MSSEEREKLKKFMYWLYEYKGWEDVQTTILLAEYDAYLQGKS